MFKREERRVRDRRGVALAFVAMLLFAFLGMAALAIDLAMLFGARTEAQRVADSSALAGALELYASGGNATAARNEAANYGLRNAVRGEGVAVLPEDVDVELDRWLVRVRVNRTQARGTPLLNIFARAIGINSSDVATVAAARLAPAVGTSCLLPFVIPDRWWVGGVEGEYPEFDDVFNPTDDFYAPIATYNPDGSIIQLFNPYTGYDSTAFGQEIRLRSDSGGGGQWGSATYFPIRVDWTTCGNGAQCHETAISTCLTANSPFFPGMTLDQEPGAMVGPTRRGFDALFNTAPHHRWSTSQNCVWDSRLEQCILPWNSPRTRVVAMFDPGQFPNNPSAPFQITNFAGVFYDRRESGDIVVRFVEYRGARAVAPELEDDFPALFRILRLVE